MENIGVSILIFNLLIIVLVVVGGWKMYAKAGQPGWAVIVPIYNMVVFLRIINVPWWHLLLCFLLLPMFVFIFTWNFKLAKKFGKGAGFAWGLIFLPMIFIPILGLSDAKYQS